MTIFFNSHQISIYRNRRVSGTNRFNFSATLTSYSADIQPLGVERAQMVDGRFGATFTAYIDSSIDIKENDQVVSGGKRYSVKAVTHWDGAGLLSHKELILISQDGQNG